MCQAGGDDREALRGCANGIGPSGRPHQSRMTPAGSLVCRYQVSLLSGPMIRPVMIVILGFALGASLGACTSNPVGRICDLGSATPAASEVVVASPSLDCVSRTCLRVPLSRAAAGLGLSRRQQRPVHRRVQSDSDCDRVPESPCIAGFTCGVAVTVGPFCCRKFCICKDYVVVPDSGQLATPKACDCLERRRTRAATCRAASATRQYPLCKG